MASPKFTFDKKSQRYRFKTGDRAGQFVSKAKVRALIEERIQQERDAIDRLAVNLTNRSIKLKNFEEGMAKRIKQLHIQSYLLGKGGEGNYDSTGDRAAMQSIIERQYRYLRGFTTDIRDGKLTVAQIKARAKMYAAAAYGSQQRGTASGHRESDRYNYEKNVLGDADHCIDCEYLSFRGVVPIGQISAINPPGTRVCKVNCRCHIEFYIEKP